MVSVCLSVHVSHMPLSLQIACDCKAHSGWCASGRKLFFNYDNIQGAAEWLVDHVILIAYSGKCKAMVFISNIMHSDTVNQWLIHMLLSDNVDKFLSSDLLVLPQPFTRD